VFGFKSDEVRLKSRRQLWCAMQDFTLAYWTIHDVTDNLVQQANDKQNKMLDVLGGGVTNGRHMLAPVQRTSSRCAWPQHQDRHQLVREHGISWSVKIETYWHPQLLFSIVISKGHVRSKAPTAGSAIDSEKQRSLQRIKWSSSRRGHEILRPGDENLLELIAIWWRNTYYS
jgi:hypothetical protein